MSTVTENERLAALRAIEVLDTPPESEFDTIVNGARYLFGCRMATVTMIDANRQWFKARYGVSACETARDISFCNYAVANDDTLIIADTAADVRFADNPLVVGPPFIRFYAGVPLRVRRPDGAGSATIGTLCVMDDRPHTATPAQIEMLTGMAHVIEALLEARRATKESMRLALARQEALIEVQRAQRLLQHAERMARIGSWRLDLATQQTYWSAQTFAIHGIESRGDTALEDALEYYPQPDRDRLRSVLDQCIADGRAWDLELDFIDAGGQQRRVRALGEPELRDGQPVALLGVIQDITERYHFERRLREVALTDELTGLASRRAFNERLDAALANRGDEPLAVAILDLDRFKEVNDRLGHAAGDDVLRVMASRLREATYLGDHLAARLGGDEFVVLLHGEHAAARLVASIERLLADLRHTVPANGGNIPVSSTIGACVADTAHADRSTLLRAADDALYVAKRSRRGTGAIAGLARTLMPQYAAD
ncbi:diguanylate cyclase [Sphingomonas sp. NBWT7]|uniref:diguanylate cyclase domain-containing protein n=1 Tax=Sphingomonas sp. NBWT7 TaxID=2596913 RepID=UPI0016242F88|nr:diguanylate cyclase [Sphingomonas sp. NBWT7]QNE30697.1 diguanylate cyclase [Sphingomonas sp. NBWT7]